MKKLLLIIIVSILLIACNSANRDLYDTNMKTHRELVKSVEDFFITKDTAIIGKYYADNFIFHSYAAGNRKGEEKNKSDYLVGFTNMIDNNMAIQFLHSVYLPGIDKNTFEIDGSVRLYYGAKLNLSEKKVEFSGYQTINFTNGKIAEIWEWADYGGVMNLLMKNNE